MTPRQFDYLMDRYELQIKRDDHRAGQIVAWVYNTGRNVEEDPEGKEWWDFFPVWQPEPEEQTEDEMFQAMLMFTKQREGLPH